MKNKNNTTLKMVMKLMKRHLKKEKKTHLNLGLERPQLHEKHN